MLSINRRWDGLIVFLIICCALIAVWGMAGLTK